MNIARKVEHNVSEYEQFVLGQTVEELLMQVKESKERISQKLDVDYEKGQLDAFYQALKVIQDLVRHDVGMLDKLGLNFDIDQTVKFNS